jgi:predicted DNA-binding transcriptional regulator AlpA
MFVGTPNYGGVPMARKLTSRALQERYGVVDRTIDRWVESGVLPQPMRINKIRYWDLEEIEARDSQRLRSQMQRESEAA